MPQYMLHHSHPAQDCERMGQAYMAYDTPLKGEGKTAPCYGCPTGDPGEHGIFIEVNAASEQEALAYLPEVERLTTRIYEVVTIPLDV